MHFHLPGGTILNFSKAFIQRILTSRTVFLFNNKYNILYFKLLFETSLLFSRLYADSICGCYGQRYHAKVVEKNVKSKNFKFWYFMNVLQDVLQKCFFDRAYC